MARKFHPKRHLFSRTKSSEKRNGSYTPQVKNPAPTARRKLTPDLKGKNRVRIPTTPPPTIPNLNRIIAADRAGIDLTDSRLPRQVESPTVESRYKTTLPAPHIRDENPWKELQQAAETRQPGRSGGYRSGPYSEQGGGEMLGRLFRRSS